MTEKQWEKHNQRFRYEPPEEPPELWSQGNYMELFNRVIGKNGMPWSCDKCSKPFTSLRQAREHVEKQHQDTLIQKAVNRQ